MLFSYLFLVAVTSLHYHNTAINYNTEISLTGQNEGTSKNVHDPSKCTIFHFTGYQSLVKQSFIFDEHLCEVTTKLESNKLHLLSNTYLSSNLRAPPVINS